MRYEHQKVVHKLLVHVELSDVLPMTKKYGSITVQPLRATLGAQDGVITYAKVYSQRVLKNGELGKDEYMDDFWPASRPSGDNDWGGYQGQNPDWLADLVAAVAIEVVDPSWQAHLGAMTEVKV